MKERVIRFGQTFILFLGIFILQKPLFLWFYHSLYPGLSLNDILRVMLHGIPLDLSLTGYLTLVPGMILIASIWLNNKAVKTAFQIYYIIITILLSGIFVVNIALYGYWGFPLDTTPIFYFKSSPADAFASVTPWMLAAGLGCWIIYGALMYMAFRFLLIRKLGPVTKPIPAVVTLVLLCGILFIPIRGGFTVSTMNVGKAYFSKDPRMNHAAVNPAFSLMESISKQKDFAKQYRFMDSKEAEVLFASMVDPQVKGEQRQDTIQKLFSVSRPNVVMIIMESFSSHLMKELGGEAIAQNLDSIAREGLLFTNFYANSFRTDRGLVSILSGYPAQPTTSIMKYSRKVESLPSIAGRMRDMGYNTAYYYGGDADFTNMRSYLISSGFDKIISDSDFPISQRLSKWGVHDHLVLQRFLSDWKKGNSGLRFRVIQTSSSHEPFEVPYHKLKNEKANAFAYTDSCVGALLREMRGTSSWKNTVVILVPDHQGCYPENLDNLSPEKYKIPLIITGGALAVRGKQETIGSQQDIAATLLGQLGMTHREFTFSKDLINDNSPHFAFFTFPDAVGMVMGDSAVMYDNQSQKVTTDRGDSRNLLVRAQAYLQKLYDDLAAR